MTHRLATSWLSCGLVLLLACGCGGHRHSTAEALTPQKAAPGAGPFGASLPSPAALAALTGRSTSGVQVLEHCGAQTDPALPLQHAAASGTALTFSPSWTPAASSPSGLALALYRFNVGGYSGAPSLSFTWTRAADFADLYVAIADFPHNRWVIKPGPADGNLTLSAQQFSDAADPATHDLFVVPLCTGTASWELALLRVGPAPNSSVTISAVTPTGQRSFAYSTFFPAYNGGEPLSWNWDFGSGATPGTAYGKTPAVKLGQAGQYIGSVTAVDPSNVPATFYFSYTVKAYADLPPHIYGVQPSSGETGKQIIISAPNDGGATPQWAWDFGGGATPSTSTQAALTITLGAIGQYNASVTATNPKGSSTFNFTLYVTAVGALQPPNILSIAPGGGNVGALTTFLVNNGGGTPDTSSWDFGGGASPNTSTAGSPQVTLGSAGLYSGTLTASNSSGSSTCNFQLAVTELAKPHLLGVTPTIAVTNALQTFTASNNGGSVTTWSWDFGTAGTPSTSASSLPQIQLGGNGSFPCSVTATNAAGSDTLNFTLTIQGLLQPNITAVSPLSGYQSDDTFFNAINSGGAVDTWAWDFGTGATPSTSSVITPHEVFAAIGNHNCSVTATNSAGSMTFNFVLAVGPPRAPFIVSATPLTAQVGQALNFSAHNAGGLAASWSWDFGGGCTPSTSTAEFPAVQAGAVGNYSCSVTATNATSSHTYNFTLAISALQAPVIDNIMPDSAETGTPISFFAGISGGPPDTYAWDFGGACAPNTSSAASPLVTPGTVANGYVVTLTVSNAAGMDSKQFLLDVIPFQGG